LQALGVLQGYFKPEKHLNVLEILKTFDEDENEMVTGNHLQTRAA
jgi:hypothetical protein